MDISILRHHIKLALQQNQGTYDLDTVLNGNVLCDLQTIEGLGYSHHVLWPGITVSDLAHLLYFREFNKHTVIRDYLASSKVKVFLFVGMTVAELQKFTNNALNVHWATSDTNNPAVMASFKNYGEHINNRLITESRQQLFNRAYLGAHAQNFVQCRKVSRARHDLNLCMYTSQDSLTHCGIGWTQHFDGSVSVSDALYTAGLSWLIDADKYDFIIALQKIHDNTPALQNYKDFAIINNLELPL